MAQKKQTGIRLSDTDEKLLAALSLKKGVSKTAIIILAIRDMAERENIPMPSPVENDNQ
jgi:hypothetical protein